MASIEMRRIGEALLKDERFCPPHGGERSSFFGGFMRDFAEVLGKFDYIITIKKPFTFSNVAEALEVRPPVVNDADWNLIQDGCLILTMYPRDKLDLEAR